jgi:ribonuclease/clavin/mitogillin
MVVVPLRTPTLPPATHTNCVLLGHGEVIVVDPASPYSEEQERLLQFIAERHLKVQAIWLTHHHADHVGGVEPLRKALQVPVCAHRATCERLMGTLAVDLELYSGDVESPGGFDVEVVHTPGHARGHLAFRDVVGRRLVAGDLVAGQGTIVIDPPEGDMADYLVTLARLIQEGVSSIIPSHGPAIADGEALLLSYIAHRKTREEEVIATLDQRGERGAYPIELVPAIYPEVPSLFHALAARQVLAHLLKLEDEGRVARIGSSTGVPGQPVYMPSSSVPAPAEVAFRLLV